MKIGLITYHFSNNYGAVLQTYATCRILKELGHQVEIINIRQSENRKLRHIVFLPKDIAFKRFMDRLYPPQTKLIRSYEELRLLEMDYDCLLVGSDQVWNPNISKDRCLAYFLRFGNKHCKRISYASSFGISDWPKDKYSLLEKVKESLHKFDAISVREATGQKLLKERFGVDSELVLDPTMLHASYPEISDIPLEKKQIVCYLLNKTKEQFKVVRYLSKEMNLKANLLTSVYPIKGMKYTYPPSIEKWYTLVGSAKFVITDSFHGLVFSLLLKRNFIVIAINDGKNSRIVDLLRLVNLEDHYFLTLEEVNNSTVYTKDIDYKKVTEILQRERQKSIAFLKEALES